jgi:hypothetical protein
LIEIISPGNKDREANVADFVDKVLDALKHDIHLLVVDVFPPGPNDPYGIHGAIQQELEQANSIYDLPAKEPLTLVAYAAKPSIEAFLEHLAVGSVLPEMPLFLQPDRYVNAPLESTYLEAYRGMPKVWRDVLEAN